VARTCCVSSGIVSYFARTTSFARGFTVDAGFAVDADVAAALPLAAVPVRESDDNPLAFVPGFANIFAPIAFA
jgi:hypothetical protein